MRTVGRYLGAVVFWVLCFIVAAQVTNRFGRSVGFTIVGLTFGAVWVGFSDRSRYVVGLLRAALDRHLPAKVAADVQGVTVSRLSEWSSGSEQWSLPRAAELPDAIWEDFCQTYLEDRGFVVVESGRLASMTLAVRALTAAVEAREPVTRRRQEVDAA